MASGSGNWSSLSDRSAKENFVPVAPQALLEKVARLPIATWSYKAQHGFIRHMGPTAQDFYAASGLGEDDTHITTVDADGVALAAIQGLYQHDQAQAARIAQLKAESADLRACMDALEERLATLEQGRSASAVPGAFLPGAGLLLLSAELGLAGGALWVWLMLAPLYLAWRRLWAGRLRLWALGLTAGLVALAIIDLFDFYSWGWPQGRLLRWTFLGLWAGALSDSAG